MRRVRLSMAMSLDGYIAGPEGDFDWIVMDPDIDSSSFTSAFDTVLLGRPARIGGNASRGETPAQPMAPGSGGTGRVTRG